MFVGVCVGVRLWCECVFCGCLCVCGVCLLVVCVW